MLLLPLLNMLITIVIKLSVLILLQINFVPECFMNEEMCDKAVNRYLFVFDSIPN